MRIDSQELRELLTDKFLHQNDIANKLEWHLFQKLKHENNFDSVFVFCLHDSFMQGINHFGMDNIHIEINHKLTEYNFKK